MTLDQLEKGAEAYVRSIDWDMIPPAEAHRLRLLGLEEGVTVELLHRGILFWRDPIGVRIGRMLIALRTAHARAIHCGDEHAATVGDTADVEAATAL